MPTIEPQPGVVLVKLPTSEFGAIPIPDKAHDSITYGQVISLNPTDLEEYGYLEGRIVHYRKYKDDARITAASDKLVFIEIKDILGSSREDN